MHIRPRISLIAAIARNGVIGRDNALPWRLSADLRRFKRETLGKPIIMGRKTWESLPGLLPERSHVVVTRDRDYQAEGAIVTHSLEEALSVTGETDVSVIGGAQLYAAALPLADRLLITEVNAAIDGDVYFPDYDPTLWEEVSRESHPADARNEYAIEFVELVRRSYRNMGILSDNAPDVAGTV